MSTVLGDVRVSRAPTFTGRTRERALLDDALNRVRRGDGAALVLRGEAGIGKTELMRLCAHQATGCRVTRFRGIVSEMEMPFAGLHQLCKPMVGHLDALPTPQRRALRVAFGLEAGDPPGLFVVGLAVLALLGKVASERPLVCLVDDAQWLDGPSRQVLSFVGRRLLSEPVLLLLAVREAGDEQVFGTLPSLTVEGLRDRDARALLTTVALGPLDEQVRDRIVAETCGNPSRLLELTREVSQGGLAGGFDTPSIDRSGEGGEGQYTRQIRALPGPTQRLLLLAAADPTGDAGLLWRAARISNVPRVAAAAAEDDSLIEIALRVRFADPAIRSAAYAAATPSDRRAAHLALAEATDSRLEPAWRIWHLAAAATGPDEVVASELERTAPAVQAHSGLAASAGFLERSVRLTAEPERRPGRALAAAHAHLRAGARDAALGLLADVRSMEIDEVQRGRLEQLRGRIEYAFNPGPDTPALLLDAARALEPVDVQSARETYLDACMASIAAGSHAGPGGLLPEVARAAQSAAPASDAGRPCDLLLDGFATVATEGRAAGAASLRRALDAFLGDEVPDNDFVQSGRLAASAACMLWDCESWEILSTKQLRLARASGALASLSAALNSLGIYAAWCGDLGTAASLAAEYDAVSEATGIGWYSACGLLHAAYQGRPDALTIVSATAADCVDRGLGQGAQFAMWIKAIIGNGLGRHEDALVAAQLAAYDMDLPNVTGWALCELIEAAVRCWQPDLARDATEQLAKHTLPDSDWAAGIQARSTALVSEGVQAEGCYAEAVRRLAHTPFRTELARAHLLFGEWLRREDRLLDARHHLAIAEDMFVTIGAEAFAERTRSELLAAGAKGRARDLPTRGELTPQEERIAYLARDGHSNPEIAALLFLSGRTVEWHMRKVFVKLGVKSRNDLKEALPSEQHQSVAA
jgi:DNA-binding CsgD family transcriptional regulator